MKMVWTSGKFIRGAAMLLLAVAGWFIVPVVLNWAAPNDSYMLRAILVMGLGYGTVIILGLWGILTIVSALTD